MRPSRERLQRRDHLRDLHLGQRPGAGLQPTLLSRAQVAPHRLHVERELCGDGLLARAGQSSSQDLLDLEHRNLAIAHRPSSPGWARTVVDRRVTRDGGNASENVSQGSLAFENRQVFDGRRAAIVGLT